MRRDEVGEPILVILTPGRGYLHWAPLWCLRPQWEGMRHRAASHNVSRLDTSAYSRSRLTRLSALDARNV
eukprot:2804347-Pyramimonas_sp.AAC.1